MKKSPKLLAIALCVSLVAMMSAGCSSTSSGEDKSISKVSTATSANESAGEDAESETESAETEAATEEEKTAAVSIEEQVLYDENDIKITATGLEESWSGMDLKLIIENNTDQSITVQARNANVNGYMVETMMSVDVAAGKKANDALTFESYSMEACGIDTIANMEFQFHIFDEESWDDIDDSDMIKIDTSAAESHTQTYDDSGEVLVDSNGVKIVGKGLSADDSFWGPGVILYIENNSEEDITVQVRDVSINGFMVDSSMSEDIIAGKKAISAVQFYDTDLEENSITDITDVELFFHVFELESWDDIFDSDVISISFN